MFDKKIYDLELESKARYNELLKKPNKNLYDMAIGDVLYKHGRHHFLDGICAFFGILLFSGFLGYFIHPYLCSFVFIAPIVLGLKIFYANHFYTKINNPYDIDDSSKCSFCLNVNCTCSVEPKTESTYDIKHEDRPNEMPKEMLNNGGANE